VPPPLQGLDDIDFGTIVVNHAKRMELRVWNENPTHLIFERYGCSLAGIRVELQSVAAAPELAHFVSYGKAHSPKQDKKRAKDKEPDDGRTARDGEGDEGMAVAEELDVSLPPGHVATFAVTVNVEDKGKPTGTIRLVTELEVNTIVLQPQWFVLDRRRPRLCVSKSLSRLDPSQQTPLSPLARLCACTYKQTLRIPVHYHAVRRLLDLQPQPLQFQPTFPGQVDASASDGVRELMDMETAAVTVVMDETPLQLLDVVCDDPRFVWKEAPQLAKVKHGERYTVGHVTFNPNIDSKLSYIPSLRASDPSKIPDLSTTAVAEAKRANKVWTQMTRNGQQNDDKHTISAKMKLVTAKEEHVLEIVALLVRPRLLLQETAKFPLTQERHTGTLDVVVQNPSRHPLLVEVVPVDQYLERPALTSITELFGISAKNMQAAQLAQGIFTVDVGGSGMQVPTTFHIPPSSNISVPLRFRPLTTGSMSSYLLFRNNLTIVEMMRVRGDAGRGTFGFPKTQSHIVNGSLTFPLTSAHLQHCLDAPIMSAEDAAQQFQFNFTVVNRGNMPVVVESMGIGELVCEGYGFRIHNCSPFTLKPKKQRRLTISFQPDFTAAHVHRKLSVLLKGADHPLFFPMVGSIPRSLISKCFDAVPGPTWAASLKSTVVSALLLAGIVLVLIEYLAGTWTRPAWLSRRPARPTKRAAKPTGITSSKASAAAKSVQKPRALPDDSSSSSSESESEDPPQATVMVTATAAKATVSAEQAPLVPAGESSATSNTTTGGVQDEAADYTEPENVPKSRKVNKGDKVEDAARAEESDLDLSSSSSVPAAAPVASATVSTPVTTPRNKRKKNKIEKSVGTSLSGRLSLETEKKKAEKVEKPRPSTPTKASGLSSASNKEPAVSSVPLPPRGISGHAIPTITRSAASAATPPPTARATTVGLPLHPNDERAIASAKSPRANSGGEAEAAQWKSVSKVGKSQQQQQQQQHPGSEKQQQPANKAAKGKTNNVPKGLKKAGAMPAVNDQEALIAKALAAASNNLSMQKAAQKQAASSAVRDSQPRRHDRTDRVPPGSSAGPTTANPAHGPARTAPCGVGEVSLCAVVAAAAGRGANDSNVPAAHKTSPSAAWAAASRATPPQQHRSPSAPSAVHTSPFSQTSSAELSHNSSRPRPVCAM